MAVRKYQDKGLVWKPVEKKAWKGKQHRPQLQMKDDDEIFKTR
jgi:hypothetical protein